MPANPLLRKLGLSATDRVAIIHTDDIGLSESSVAAARELWQAGIITSSAVMVPCPWFPAVAALCRANPGIDMGVHVTLTSEWDTIRWGPISTRDTASGLIDPEGYFYRGTAEAQAHARPEAVAAEITAQIARAVAAGIDVTHIDTHMGTVFHPALLPAYVQAGLANRVPAMLPRLNEDQIVHDWDIDRERAVELVRMIAVIEAQGMPFLDHIVGMPLNQPENRLEQLLAAYDALQPGITHFIIHPSTDTPEARAAYPDLPARIGDYQTHLDEHIRDHLKQRGILTLGYRQLRDLMRQR